MVNDHDTNPQTLPSDFTLKEERFKIIKTLGQGGFGVTYLADDGFLDRGIVLKECFPTQIAYRDQTTLHIHPNSSDDQEDFEWCLRRFQDEARTLAKFRHPNMLSVQDIFEENNTVYMVIDYIDGEPLAHKISAMREEEKSQNEEDIRRILDPLMDVLAMVHKKGVLHRDIAPDNVMITTDGDPVLIDFGAARQAVGQKSKNISTIVKDGYSPPEQYSQKNEQGPYTDIYALSAMIYELMSNEKPVDAPSRQTALSDDDPDPLVPLSERVGNQFSPALIASIEAGLILSRKQRPQSIKEWQKGCLEAKNIGSPNEPASKRSKKKAKEAAQEQEQRKRQRIKIASISALILMVASSIYASNSYLTQQKAFTQAIEANTVSAYEYYLDRYDEDFFASLTGNLKAVEEPHEITFWQQAKSENSIIAYEGYIRNWPNGIYIQEAEAGLVKTKDLAAWQQAKSDNTVSAYEEYLDNWQNGIYLQEAETGLAKAKDLLAWQKAKADNTVSAYEEYLDNWQNGIYLQEAETGLIMVKGLEARKKVNEGSENTFNNTGKSSFADCKESSFSKKIKSEIKSFNEKQLLITIHAPCDIGKKIKIRSDDYSLDGFISDSGALEIKLDRQYIGKMLKYKIEQRAVISLEIKYD